MTIRYKILYAISLLHEYYANRLCKDFVVVPSANTVLLLQRQRLLCKMVGNQLLILAQVNDNDEPIVPLESTGKYVFYLSLQKSSFTTITNLRLDKFGPRRFYFSNLLQNKAGNTLFVSQKLKNYDNAIAYIPGSLADDGAGNIYECIKASTGNAVTDTNFWRAHNTLQYATDADMLPFVQMTDRYQLLVAAKDIVIKAFAYDTGTADYTKELVLKDNTLHFSDPIDQVQVNLSTYPPGLYKVVLNGEVNMVYADDESVQNNYFGAVEIFSHLPAANDFALLGTDGKVKEKVVSGLLTWLSFTIAFANRIAYWKYMTPKGTVTAIDDTNNTFSFSRTPAAPQPSLFYQSTRPIPLSEQVQRFDVKLTTDSNGPHFAPNPNPDITGMLSKAGDDFYCTVYLNY